MGAIVNLNNQSGFTLIEFCVAVLIMMVGLMGLLQAINMATMHNLGSVLRNEAISLADEQMVLAKTSVYDSATFAALDSTSDLVSRRSRSSFCNYSVNRGITTVGTNLKEVSVRVTWRYKGNRANHIISTLITNPNPL